MYHNLTIALLTLFIFSNTHLSAQRIAEPDGTVSHIRLPSTPLPAAYTTYSVSINPIKLLHSVGYSASGLSNKQFNLEGFKRVGANGHFHVAITLETFAILESEMKKRTSKSKDKEGKVTETNTYEKEVKYYMPMTLYVEDYKGNILLETVGGGVDKPIEFTYKKGKNNFTFNSTSKLNEAWRKDKVANKLRKELVDKTLADFSQELRDLLDTRVVQSRFYFEEPKGKKVPNVALHEKHTAAAIASLSQIKPGVSLDATRSALEGPIQFWTNELRTLSPTDKKQRKLYHACLYNLAVSHYWLDDLDQAQSLAEQLEQEVDWNKDRATNLLQRIVKTRQLFSANEKDSRYFSFEAPTDATGPAEADYSHLLPATERAAPGSLLGDSGVVDATRELNGYVVVRGDSLWGQFRVADAKLETPRFYLSGNVMFYTDMPNGVPKTISVVPNEIEKMQMGSDLYIRTSRGVKMDPSGRTNYAFLRILEDGPKVKVMERFPTLGEKDDIGDPTTTYFLQKAGEKMISLDVTNVRWTNWKGAFAKYFEDCTVLQAEIAVGNYKRNIDEIRKAAQIYNANDCE